MRATLCSVIQVDVRPLAAEELALIQQALPPEHPEAHVRRLGDQRAGRVTYLVAWADGRALGHALVRWGGATNPELRWRLDEHDGHPYVEALLVHPSFRSRSVGSQILDAAEVLVRRQGLDRIGLAVAVENTRARVLYERLGYRDLDIGEFDNAWSYVDEHGNEVAESETCAYLVKDLVKTLAGHAGQVDRRERRLGE
jgi:ribosomal protein S18 acetylase RimI-like enzyme